MVGERAGEPKADLPAGVEPAPDWQERVRAAHAEGYAVVAGAIEWRGALAGARALAAYAPGPAASPASARRCSARRCCPASSSSRLDDVAGLPAFAAPRDEPGSTTAGSSAVRMQSSTAIRSSTALKTSAPSTSASAAATTR